MAETTAPRSDTSSEIKGYDWTALEEAPEFQELVNKKKRFVIPATIFFLSFYMGFILLAGYAPDFMADSVYEGLTVGYCLALTQFVMVFVLGIWYLKKSNDEYDPMRERVIEMAERTQPGNNEEEAPAGNGAGRETATAGSGEEAAR